ncbi:MAG: hypothetical protein V4616_14245 [Bacteroidota bacterium]
MSNVQFSDAEINMLKMHYLQEYNTTVKKLEELNTILKRLGVSTSVSHIPSQLPGSAVSKSARQPSDAALEEAVDSMDELSADANGTRRPGRPAKGGFDQAPAPKKKFVKMSWAKFVKMTLKASPTPMSAPELLEAGRDQFSITDETRTKAMQALQATLFRLSKKSDVLGSEKQKGSYVGYFLNK